MKVDFPNVDIDSIPDVPAVLTHIDRNLEVLQLRALGSDFSDPAARMHFKNDVATVRRYFDRAERLLLG